MNGLGDLRLYGNWILDDFKKSKNFSISDTNRALFQYTYLEKEVNLVDLMANKILKIC